MPVVVGGGGGSLSLFDIRPLAPPAKRCRPNCLLQMPAPHPLTSLFPSGCRTRPTSACPSSRATRSASTARWTAPATIYACPPGDLPTPPLSGWSLPRMPTVSERPTLAPSPAPLSHPTASRLLSHFAYWSVSTLEQSRRRLEMTAGGLD